MARLFDDAASDDLTVSQVDVSAFPVSMACWVRPDAVSANSIALAIRRHNAVRGFEMLLVPSSNTVQARVSDGSATSASAKSSTWVLDTWGHLGATFPSITSRTVLWNGVAGTENTDSRDPFVSPAVNRTTIGMRVQGGEGEHFSGDLAEAAIWAAALTAEEFAALAAGTSPLLIRPAALVNYYPIIGRHSPEIDLVGGNNLTVNGAAASDHPRMFYPARSRLVPARGVTERTFAASLQGAIRKQLEISVSLDAGVRKEFARSAAADAAVAALETRTSSLEAAVHVLMTAQANLEAAVRATANRTAGLDAKLDAGLGPPFAPAGTRTFGHGEDRGQVVTAGGRTFVVPAGNRKH